MNAEAEIVARHEAAHAIALVHRNVRVAHVSLGDAPGVQFDGHPERQLGIGCAALAGAISTAMFKGASDFTKFMSNADWKILAQCADSNDPEAVAQYALLLEPGVRQYLARPAIAAAVDEVAKALLERGSMTGAEVRAIVNRHREPEVHPADREFFGNGSGR